MKADVYEKLAKHLDDLPPGYPRTDSGVEMRILRQLFTPEEAALAVHLSLIEEDARVIARRARIPLEEAEKRLDEMEKPPSACFSMPTPISTLGVPLRM